MRKRLDLETLKLPIIFLSEKLTYSRFYPEINFHGRFAHKNAELIRS